MKTQQQQKEPTVRDVLLAAEEVHRMARARHRNRDANEPLVDSELDDQTSEKGGAR